MNFNPQNIPAKIGRRLGGVSFNRHVLPRRTVDVPHTQANPRPTPPPLLIPEWGETVEMVRELEGGLGSSVWVQKSG